MVTIVARIWLPDRPGALGQVASRVGAVGGDVLSIEILERGAGQVVDELTIALAQEGLIPLLASEVGCVDGVSVETIRLVEADRADPSLLALTVAAELAETRSAGRLSGLCEGVQRIIEADWAVVIGDRQIVASVGDPPDLPWLLAFGVGAEHLDAGDPGPTDLVWGQLAVSGLSVAAGRAERPIHDRERVRMSLFVRLADALVD